MNEMRDWPHVLKLNAAAAGLAKFIYYAREEVYGRGQLWEALSPDLHRQYIDIAQRLLTDLAPKHDLPAEPLRLVKP